MPKVTVCMDWLDACAGCEMSVLDIDERIVELIKYVQLLSTPITDLKHPPKEGADVGILTGSVSNDHQEEIAHMFRERCKVLIALGDCAVFGGICTMRNFFDTEECLRRGLPGDREHRTGPGDSALARDRQALPPGQGPQPGRQRRRAPSGVPSSSRCHLVCAHRASGWAYARAHRRALDLRLTVVSDRYVLLA